MVEPHSVKDTTNSVASLMRFRLKIDTEPVCFAESVKLLSSEG